MTDAGKRGWVYDIERSTKGTQYAKVVDSPSRFFYLDGVLKASSECTNLGFSLFPLYVL